MGMRARAGPELVAGGRAGLAGPDDDEIDGSFDELYAEAQRRHLKGRSTMTKDELQKALRRRRRAVARPTKSRTRRA